MPTATKVRAKPKGEAKFVTPERASANFSLRFGLISIPVALKPLYESAKMQISGTTICPEHREKLKQVYVCGDETEHEHLMPKGDTEIAYEFPPKSGTYVSVPEDVIEEIVQQRTGGLAIEQIAPLRTIDSAYYEKSYLVWPQDLAAAEAFDLLAAILREENAAAVCRGVMSKKTRTIVFRWSDELGVMLAHVTAFTNQLRERDVALAREGTESRKAPSKDVLAAAKPLLAALYGDFDPSEAEDEYTPALLEAIKNAANGKHPVASKAKKATAPKKDDLLSALRASVATSEPASPSGKKRTPAKSR